MIDKRLSYIVMAAGHWLWRPLQARTLEPDWTLLPWAIQALTQDSTGSIRLATLVKMATVGPLGQSCKFPSREVPAAPQVILERETLELAESIISKR